MQRPPVVLHLVEQGLEVWFTKKTGGGTCRHNLDPSTARKDVTMRESHSIVKSLLNVAFSECGMRCCILGSATVRLALLPIPVAGGKGLKVVVNKVDAEN